MSKEAIYRLHTRPSGEVEEFEFVQELVRCKNCDHADLVGCGRDRCYCLRLGVYMDVDDFCSYGERSK